MKFHFNPLFLGSEPHDGGTLRGQTAPREPTAPNAAHQGRAILAHRLPEPDAGDRGAIGVEPVDLAWRHVLRRPTVHDNR